RIVRTDRNLVAAEFETGDAIAGCRQLAQLVAQADACTLLLQQPDRGLNQDRGQTITRDQGPACLPAREQRLAHDRARKAGGPNWRAAKSRGFRSRWYSVPSQRIASPTSLPAGAQTSGASAR